MGMAGFFTGQVDGVNQPAAVLFFLPYLLGQAAF